MIPLRTRERDLESYAWVEHMLSAADEWASLDSIPEDERENNTTVHGSVWRLLVSRSEIYVSLGLDRVSYGPERCCMRLELARSIDVETFARHFGMRGEISRLDDLRAVGSRSFAFRLNDVPLLLTVISPDSARVQRRLTPN